MDNVENTRNGWKEVAPGVRLQTLEVGRQMHMVAFQLGAGGKIPPHIHPHEQCGYLVSGKVVMERGNGPETFYPGASWSIPGGVEHGVEVVEESLVVEVFSPVREDYLNL